MGKYLICCKERSIKDLTPKFIGYIGTLPHSSGLFAYAKESSAVVESTAPSPYDYGFDFDEQFDSVEPAADEGG